MYRVELKVAIKSVPSIYTLAFLMYRMELKAPHGRKYEHLPSQFLMYRVELKVVKVNCLVSWIPHGFLMYRVELKEGLTVVGSFIRPS